MRRAFVAAVAVGVLLGCTEEAMGPARCPDFCPPGAFTLVDTLLTGVIERDTAFTGYLSPSGAAIMIASTLPGVVDSRPIIRLQPLGTTLQFGSDTAHYAIAGTDSARLELTVIRRDTNVRNLRLQLYRLAPTLDSTTTFGDLTGPFVDSLVRVINVDSLVRAANQKDTVTQDSVRVDGAHVLVRIKLDSAQARFVAADSGVLAYGVRIAADTATSAAFGSNESGDPPLLTWYFRVDSAGTMSHQVRSVAPQFDSYVFDPPPAALDSTLAVGGMPSSRSVVRVVLPRRLRDSTQILRATLQLVPAVPARGAPIDSFTLVAHAVVADLGGKSPLIGSLGADSSFLGTGPVLINSTDTVRVEITRILRRWAADTLAPNAFVLRSASEGGVLTEIRFQPSANAAFRPTIRLTYASKYPFGLP